MSDATDLEGALAGRYEIERELGRGGMATVYLAADMKHGRRVAIKVLDDATAAAIGRDRFLREIEILARLTHPHILPLHDSGDANGRLYYVMPHIEGASLRERIERERRLPLEEALRLTREIASALGHAHRQGLVHRDVKPENVLLAEGYALVADFGIARAPAVAGAAVLTAPGAALGTPAYMAPEQVIGGADVDERADGYALACLLFEMLAGQPPFTGPPESLYYQQMNAMPRPVSELRPGVPDGVVAAIARALAKVPGDRFATVTQFAEALAAPAPGPARDAAGTPNNLPRERTAFVGRDRELQDGERLLEQARLVTLTGIGGAGKTRLALRLAERSLERFPDGVWLVDLAPVQDAERVALTTAAALGVSESPGTPMIRQLTTQLATARALLVLDNCEHVLEAAAALAEALLAGCADVRILATSREGMGVPGEHVVALRSLPTPAAGATDVAAIAAADAVRLFVERARLANPRFALDAANAAAVVEICRRLDGIPLALELAAVRVKMLSVEEIRARLGDRFRLLTGGSKTALPRHQTLRATVEWSYDQLAEEEQRLLERLAVFAGGWTLDAAVHVAGTSADEFETLDVLTRLADKSLVMADASANGSTRYSMLETMREYAHERLDARGEGEDARARHGEFYRNLAETGRRQIEGPEQGAWLARFDLERENLLSAHAWCLRAGDPQHGLQLAFALQLCWVARGLLELGYHVTTDAISRPGAEPRTTARMHACFAAGQLGYLTGRFTEARAHLEESLSIARELDERVRGVSVLRMLGVVAQGLGDPAASRRRLEEALALSRELNQPRQLALTLNGLAELERLEGNLDAAEPIYEEFLTVERALGDRGHVASGLLNLGMVAAGRGAIGQARTLLLEALAIAEEIGSRRVGQGVVEATAGLAADEGSALEAARFYGAADAQRERMGLHRDPADEAFVSPRIARARMAAGASAFAREEAAGRALTYEAATTEAREWLGAAR